jgi:hypothetical protein
VTQNEQQDQDGKCPAAGAPALDNARHFETSIPAAKLSVKEREAAPSLESLPQRRTRGRKRVDESA